MCPGERKHSPTRSEVEESERYFTPRHLWTQSTISSTYVELAPKQIFKLVERAGSRGDRTHLRAAISAADVDTIMAAFVEAECKAAALQDWFNEISSGWRKEKEKRRCGDAKVKDLDVRLSNKCQEWFEADSNKKVFQQMIYGLCEVIEMGTRASRKCEWFHEASEFARALELPVKFRTCSESSAKEDDDDEDGDIIALSDIKDESESDKD